jgi:hypothetical protein
MVQTTISSVQVPCHEDGWGIEITPHAIYTLVLDRDNYALGTSSMVNNDHYLFTFFDRRLGRLRASLDEVPKKNVLTLPQNCTLAIQPSTKHFY